MNYTILKKNLIQKSTPERAETSKKFFKMGKGDYAENDQFIGVSVPDIRRIAKLFPHITLSEIEKLFKSPIHEERHLGIIILLDQFRQGELEIRNKIFNFYLKHRKCVNNWDLVDTSAANLVGAHCFMQGSHAAMDQLLISKRHWDRRIAVVATHYFIRQGMTKLTFKYAECLLNDEEDLMHKATGWMLREAGKNNPQALKKFIKINLHQMPRTMLRYSIERFNEKERKKILNTNT
jgi:3-methyladenine DNA glycosylase AlkD